MGKTVEILAAVSSGGPLCARMAPSASHLVFHLIHWSSWTDEETEAEETTELVQGYTVSSRFETRQAA